MPRFAQAPGRNPTPANAPTGAFQRSLALATRQAGLPVRLITLVLLSQIFADAPDSSIFRTIHLDRFFFLVLLVTLFSTRSIAKSEQHAKQSQTVTYVMALFSFVLTLSWLITGSDFGTGKYRWLVTLYNFSYCPLVMYLIVKKTRYSREVTGSLLRAMAGIGAYLVLTGIFEHYRISFLVWPQYILNSGTGDQRGRMQGPFGNSAHMGEWVLIAFVCASLLVFLGKGKSWLSSNTLRLLMVGGIYFTETRSIWLDFAVVLGMSLLFASTEWRKQSRTILILISIGFVLGIGSKFSIGEGTLFSKRTETVDYRLANIQVALRMGMNHFLMGNGYGTFNSQWQNYFGSGEEGLVHDLSSGNESTYLGLFAETGIIGLLLYVLVLLFAIKKCISVWKLRPKSEDFERSFIIATISLFVAVLLQGLFGDLRFALATNTVVFLFLGIVMSMENAGPITDAAEGALQ
jgi:O-antigen ligase